MAFDRRNRDDMIWLQDALYKLGIMTPVRIGLYDSHTRKAIARYQAYHKLLLTGSPDDSLIAHIKQQLVLKNR